MRDRNIDWLPLVHPQTGIRPATQACAPTGNRTSNILGCRLALSPLSHAGQGQGSVLTPPPMRSGGHCGRAGRFSETCHSVSPSGGTSPSLD